MFQKPKRKTLSKPKSYRSDKDIHSSSSPIPHRANKKVIDKRSDKWSKEEDEQLKAVLQVHGSGQWEDIATYLPGRNSTQCFNRWRKVLNPDRVKGKWTKEEDEKLLQLVQIYGTKKWTLIGMHLKGRNGKQIRERWHNHLDPSVKKTAWTSAEEKLIIHYHKLWGNQWSKIAKELPGRSDNAIKNHWNTALLGRCPASDSKNIEQKKKVVKHSKKLTKSKKPASSSASSLPDNQSCTSTSSHEEAPVVSWPESDKSNFNPNLVKGDTVFSVEDVQMVPVSNTVPFPGSSLSGMPESKTASVPSKIVKEESLFSVESLPEIIVESPFGDDLNLDESSTNNSGSSCPLPISGQVNFNRMSFPNTPKENPVATRSHTGCLVSMVETSKKQKLDVGHKSSVEHRSFDGINTQKKSVSCTKAEESVISAMKIIYFQAKENLNTLKFSALKDFLTDFGCSSTSGITVNSNIHFESYDSFGDMDTAMASMIQENLVKQINEARWFSIVIDECSDVSRELSVIIFVKFFHKGKVVTRFLCLTEIEEVSAAKIFVCVSKTLLKLGIDFSKCSSLAIDGPSVMKGVRAEVAALFRKHNPHLLSLHCVAHRISLALTQAAEEFPYLIKYRDVLKRAHSYFEKSPAKTNRLHHIQQGLSPTNKKLLKLSSIRWLSLGNSVLNIDTSWSALISVFAEDKCPESQELLKQMTSYMFVATTAMLNDVVFCVNKLQMAFQKKNLDFEFARACVIACLGNLKSMRYKTGTYFKNFKNKTPKDAGETFMYDAHVVADSIEQRIKFEVLMNSFLVSMIGHIEDRLGDMDKIEIFNIFLPSNLPNNPSEF